MPPSQDTSQSTDVAESSNETPTVVSRSKLGKFVKGVSGNPAGRQLGSKNRTTLIKQAMEESLVRDLAKDFNDIVSQVIKLAKEGDTDMIKLLLNDVMKEARKPIQEDDERRGPRKLHVEITQYLGPESNPSQEASKAIDAVFEVVKTNPS